jgi:hypothetical protein
MNRIEILAIVLFERMKVLTPIARAEADKAASLVQDEYEAFQDLKSYATACNWLTLEEGMYIYEHMGNTLEQFNRQRLEVKVALNMVFLEMHKRCVEEESHGLN